MPINVTVPGDTQITLVVTAIAADTFQRTKIEWDNGNGPTDTFTTTTTPCPSE